MDLYIIEEDQKGNEIFFFFFFSFVFFFQERFHTVVVDVGLDPFYFLVKYEKQDLKNE